jgi:hypothetical protein
MGPSCKRPRLSWLPAFPKPMTVCLHPLHVPAAEEDPALSPDLSARSHATIRGACTPLPQGSSAPVQVMLSRSIIAYTTPSASPTGTLRLRGIALIRSAFAVRERLGDPGDLPYFRCCSFHTCRRPYPGGPLTLCPVYLVGGSRLPRSWSESSPATSVSASNSRRVFDFGAASVRFMLRPVCLPSPPDWLRRDEITCSPPRLLRYIVTPAFDAARCRAALGVRLNGRTGNLPLSGLPPNQLQQLVRLQPRLKDSKKHQEK